MAWSFDRLDTVVLTLRLRRFTSRSPSDSDWGGDDVFLRLLGSYLGIDRRRLLSLLLLRLRLRLLLRLLLASLRRSLRGLSGLELLLRRGLLFSRR